MAAAAEMLGQFTTEEFRPVLSSTEQTVLREYLAYLGMRAGLGILDFERNQPVRTQVLLGHDSEARRLLELSQDAILGPYFLEDIYYPEGVAIWVPNN